MHTFVVNENDLLVVNVDQCHW